MEGDTAYLTISEPRFIFDDAGLGIRIFGEVGVEIVDLSDPTAPTKLADWKLHQKGFTSLANSGVNPNHDLYVQDGVLYNAFWDAGVIALDVTDPTNPEFLAQFGTAPNADTPIRPFRPGQESFSRYQSEVFPLQRYLSGEGNTHYVQPSPAGNRLFVGDEKFPGTFERDPASADYGGIRIFDIEDMETAKQVDFIAPPDGDQLRTAHNFDVTRNRLVSGWYNGGVRVHDITDFASSEELARYRPEGFSFWTAVETRSLIVGGIIGNADTPGGIVLLHDDRGEKSPPSFDGGTPPQHPAMGVLNGQALQ